MKPQIPFFPLDIIFVSAVRVTIPPNGGGIIGATGFIWKEDDKIFLVTNKHVIFGKDYINQPFLVDWIKTKFNRINIKDPSSLTPPSINDLETIECKVKFNDESKILKHNNKQVDLVLVDVSECPIHGSIVYPFTRNNLPPPDLLVTPSDPLIVIGYPLDFFDELKYLPIARAANLSTPYGLKYKGKEVFLTDSILHPGTSGSPIILDPRVLMKTLGGGIMIGNNRPPILLGVHSGEDATVFDKDDIRLNTSWYSSLITEIIAQNLED